MFRTSDQVLILSRGRNSPQWGKSSAYSIAFDDPEFLCREELRPVRLQLELLKPDLLLLENQINSTVVVFGGAWIPEPGAQAKARTKRAIKSLEEKSSYYAEARDFSRLVSNVSKVHNSQEFVIASGGGPGIMEAANRGAADVGAPSIGLNIVLPDEQDSNKHITRELSFQFHYFAIRKMHFLLRAKAISYFPGGFGTLDELFEALTLIQTKKMVPVPVVLFGKEFWNRIINFDALVDEGTISPRDLKLFSYVESAEEGWEIIREFYNL